MRGETDLQPWRDLLQGCFDDFLDLVEPGLRQRERLETVRQRNPALEHRRITTQAT